MPSKKKKYNSRFPPARIKKIMQTDEDVGKVAAAVPVIISRSLELFIESLILKSNATTQARKAKTLSTAHIKHTIVSERKFDFLKDLVADVPDVQQADDDSGDGQPSNSHSETSTGRPRGRPRKKKVEGETDRPKRRPRKEKVEVDDSATEDADSDGNGDESTESDDDRPDPQTSNAHRGAPGPLSTPAFRDYYPRPDFHGNSIPESDGMPCQPGHLTASAFQGGVDRNSAVGTSASCPTEDSHLTAMGTKNNNCFRLPGTSGFPPMAPPVEPMPYMYGMYGVPAHPPPQHTTDDDYDS